MSKHCTRCGNAATEDALFCPRCGNSLKGAGADPLLGTIVADRYLIVEKLGQGGSGTVYRGEHTSLRKRVAVKLLHLELSTDENASERFRREATTVADLDHDHIVQVLDFGHAVDGRLYVASEFVEGETLAKVLEREKTMPVIRVVDIVGQIAEALMEAHALGYVHRDLRPGNIILTRKRSRNDFVKLLDFGLAQLIFPARDASGQHAKVSFGDPRYLSPEQVRGDIVDRRSDVYGLGAIAFEMLTGAPPFTGASSEEILKKQLESIAPSVRAKRGDCPEWLDKVIQLALAKAPEDRFVTVLKMHECLTSQTAPLPALERAATASVGTKSTVADKHDAPRSAAAHDRITGAFGSAPAPAKPLVEARPAEAREAKSAATPTKSRPSAEEPGPVHGKPAEAKSAAPVTESRPVGATPSASAAPAPIAAASASATVQGNPGGGQGSKKSKRQAKAERRSDEQRKQRDDSGRPVESQSARPVEAQIPAQRPPNATLLMTQLPSTASSSGESASASVKPNASRTDSAAKVQLAPGVVESSKIAKVDVRPNGKNGSDKRDGGPLYRSSQTGEHEKLWFDENANPPHAAEDFSEEFRRKRNLPMMIGFSVAGAVVLVLAGAILLWPRAPREKVKERSYDTPAVSASLAGKSIDPGRSPETAPVPPTPSEGTPSAALPAAAVADNSAASNGAAAPQAVPVENTAAVPAAPPVEEKPPEAAKAPPEPAPAPVAIVKADPRPEPRREPKVEARIAAKPQPKAEAHVKEPAVAKPTDGAKDPFAAKAVKVDAGGGGGGKSDPTQSEFFSKMGRQKLSANDISAAVADFKKAREYDSKNGDAIAGLGECSFEQGDYGQAVGFLKQAVKLSPRRLKFQVLLGQAQYKSGKTAEAIATCRNVLSAEPGNNEARRCVEVGERKLGAK